MASGTIPEPWIPRVYGRGTTSIDVTPYISGTAFAYLVVARAWRAATDAEGLYLVAGIQSSLYVTIDEIVKGSAAPTLTVNGTTMTVSWPSTDGYISIIPLMR